MDQMKKKKRTLVLKFFLIKPEFPYLQKKRLLTCISKGWPTRVFKSVVRLSTHICWWTPRGSNESGSRLKQGKTGFQCEVLSVPKNDKGKKQKNKKKKSKIENLTLMGATQQAHDSLCTHTHRSPIWKWNLNPRGFLDQNRSSGFKPCVNSKRGRLFWHFITCKTTKKTTTTTKITHNWAWTTKRWWKPNFFFFFWFDRDGPW